MVGGQRLTFDAGGLDKGVLAMQDRQTDTAWAQGDGSALAGGPLEGERLGFVPMPLMTWSEWQAAYPNTEVLDLRTPYEQGYRQIRTGLLTSRSLVIGVETEAGSAAFPLVVLERVGGVVNVEVGGVPVVVFYNVASGTGFAFARTVNGQTLDFTGEVGPDIFPLVDDETGSTWDIVGRAVEGPLAGASLGSVPSFISEWYGWVGYHPETAVYLGGEGEG